MNISKAWHRSSVAKDFIKNFNIDNPDWVNVPVGIPNIDYDGLDGKSVGKLNAIKTMWELSQKKKPEARSRVWK